MIDQKFSTIFQISEPTNIPQKWFSTQNVPLDIRFQMRLDPNHVGFFISGKMKHKLWNSILQRFKEIAPQFLPYFSRNKKLV